MTLTKDEERIATNRFAKLVRQRRREMGLSQSDVAKRMGISFQQMQKYESGDNRISLAKFEILCDVLGTPPSYYFPCAPKRLALPPREEALIKAWCGLDEKCQRALEDLAHALALNERMP